MTTKKTFEFATWPCSDKYADDPKTAQPAFRGLLEPERVKGLNTIFIGVDKEKQNGRAVLCWDSLQDHLNFIADKERQASVAEQFADAMTGGVVMEHTILSVDTALLSLEAPLTELVRITFSDRGSLEKVKVVVDKYAAYANREETPPIAAAFGQTVDLENVEETKVILIVGWKTAEDQERARKSDEMKEFIKEMAQIGEFEARTISLGAVHEKEAA
ncbi:hypothetical protein BJY52DRAFT_590770 [Lactarius psammicola]|nr:hypothetical protein BJY52DRAFT_590770 [Lactarius psammicola]